MDKYEVSIYNLKMLVNIIKINIRSTQFAKTLNTSTSRKIYRFEKIKKGHKIIFLRIQMCI